MTSFAKGDTPEGGEGYLPSHPPGIFPGEEAQALYGPRVRDCLPAALVTATPPGRYQRTSPAVILAAAIHRFIQDLGVGGRGGDCAAKACSCARTPSRPWRDAGSWQPAYRPWSSLAMMNWNEHGVRAPGSPCLVAKDARMQVSR